MRSIPLVALFFVFTSASLVAAPPGGIELSSLKARAFAGDNSARYRLGMLFESGIGVKADLKQAAQYFRAGAEGQHPACLGKYAMYLIDGVGGTAKDVSSGVRMLQKAAELRDPEGTFYLGLVNLDKRMPGGKNERDGVRYVETACSLKSPSALNCRAEWHYFGYQGYAKNPEAAKRDWLEAAMGLEAAAEDLDEERTQFTLYHTYRRAESFDQAKKWQKRGISCGNYQIILDKATSHLYGSHGETLDLVQAYAYFNLASCIRPEPFPEASQIAANSRDDVAKKMSKDQVAEAQRIATEMNATIRK